ncbi:MAG TPA: hypothetical protein VHC90_06775 [Bryobacteraceae bacterium]|nr:hypothetical protein [Bryobacteraceae bacterium]
MFVLKDGSLVQMKASQFAKEDDFQSLLEQHPELLVGELVDPEDPRRWLLVTREIAIPSEPGGGGWWSADHLFLDQDGIPTIVEVKRQSDTRLRREVVAQMLDYAANAVACLPASSIRSSFEETCARCGKDPDQELQKSFGNNVESAKFWQQVKTNIEAQRIRLLFVADAIPRELRRIVEFLNRQMNPAEVLALELRHYSGENGLRTLVPTIYGQTEEARGIKSAASASTVTWDEESVFERLALKATADELAAARSIVNWMKARSKIRFGHGKQEGSINSSFQSDGEKLYPLSLSSAGIVYVYFGYCVRGRFKDAAKRQEWLSRLNEIPEVRLPADSCDKYPGIQLAVLAPTERLAAFLKVMDWFVSELG